VAGTAATVTGVRQILDLAKARLAVTIDPATEIAFLEPRFERPDPAAIDGRWNPDILGEPAHDFPPVIA